MNKKKRKAHKFNFSSCSRLLHQTNTKNKGCNNQYQHIPIKLILWEKSILLKLFIWSATVLFFLWNSHHTSNEGNMHNNHKIWDYNLSCHWKKSFWLLKRLKAWHAFVGFCDEDHWELPVTILLHLVWVMVLSQRSKSFDSIK